MANTAATLDDIALAITDLGSMIGEQFARVDEQFAGVNAQFVEIRQEIAEMRQDIGQLKLEVGEIRTILKRHDDELEALRSDIREIYDRLTALEVRIEQESIERKAALRHELDVLKLWVREISNKIGLSEPKF
jgi:septal ring factor EnvC (AmiA/AmiB activator)